MKTNIAFQSLEDVKNAEVSIELTNGKIVLNATHIEYQNFLNVNVKISDSYVFPIDIGVFEN